MKLLLVDEMTTYFRPQHAPGTWKVWNGALSLNPNRLCDVWIVVSQNRWKVVACDFPKHRQHSHAFLARALWHQTKRDSPCEAASNRAQHTIVAKYPAMLEAYSEQLSHASRRSLW